MTYRDFEVGQDFVIGQGFYPAPYPHTVVIGAPAMMQMQPFQGAAPAALQAWAANRAQPAYPPLALQAQITPPANQPMPFVNGYGQVPYVLQPRAPQEGRLQPMGLNTAAVVAANGGVGQAISRPQRKFKPIRYEVMPSIAPQFMIDSLLIGVDPQSPANVAIAAESYLPDADGAMVDWTMAEPNTDVVANVRNTSGEDAFYLSTLFGKTLV